MSTETDQRVVEMRFDNRQFEKGTKETMSTLDRLREKLRFKGAEEGFENLSQASRKVDFEEMGGALDTIQMKFSALDVIAATTLSHITEKVISTGEQLVKSLSIDNVSSGWEKYAEKTGNVQTIMNATGKTVDQVNGYLEKLMWYSDETSFSFAEMTSALSQATASGGDIGKMIPMIMGIANATADAGKSGFAFQSTIRNLMQSYSAGYLQLMDWKSLNLMGTGTKALKQELISTAEELGTIEKGDVTIANFENTLSKKWATTEVMEKTFAKYSQMMTDAYALTQQNKGMTTSEALEQLSGKYGEIAERSAKAAQQTFVDLIGWMWDGGDTGNGGIKAALDELGENVLEGIKNIFAPFENGLFQQRNIAVHFNPDFKAERVKLSDVFGFSSSKDEAKKAGKEIGNNFVQGNVEGLNDGKDAVSQAGAELGKAASNGEREATKTHSPSQLFAENGMYLALGLVEGIQNGKGKVCDAMYSLANGTRKVFCDFWGIHSPSDQSMSDAENILEGIVLGIADKERREEIYQEAYATGLLVRDATSDAMDQAITVADQKSQELATALYRAQHMFNTQLPTSKLWRDDQSADIKKAYKELSEYSSPEYNAVFPGKNGLTTKKNQANGTKLDIKSDVEYIKDTLNRFGLDITKVDLTKLWNALTGSGEELNTNTILEQWSKLVDEAIPDSPKIPSGGKSGGSSTKNQKTAAEELASKYTALLKSNKTLQDIADKEWDLWDTKDGKTADPETYLAKKNEALEKALDLQDKRVGIAQEQYDKLQAEASATEDQKNEALSTLLDEQKSLEELKRERYETLYEEVLSRYSDNSSTVDDEYDHWAAFNEKTASLTEKSDRKIKKITDKLGLQAEVSAAAKKKYHAIADDLGESSVEATKAYREWLEAETEQQELQNELCEAQLAIYDDKISRYELEMKTVSNRQNMLNKLYGDGDYGTVTQTITLTTALQNMSYELKRVQAASDKYDSYVQSNTQNTDDGIAALQTLQEERYSFVGYAETFADALDMDDDGKHLMMQLGLAVADNWTYVRDGIGKAYNRLRGMLPEAAQSLSDLWGLFQRDGMAETITSAASVFVSIIEGDYGTALGSALSFALNLTNTNFGKTLTGWIGDQLSKIDWSNIPGIGTVATAIGGLFREGGILSGLGGLFSEGGIFAGIGEAVAGLGLTVPQLGLIAAAIGAVGFAGYELINHWEDVQKWFKDFGEWWSNLFQNLWKGVKNFFGGIWEGISGFFGGVVEVGSNIAGGLWEGIKSGAKFVWDGVTGFGKSLINGFNTLFGIHSPSTVMAEMGGYLGQGLANGITGTSRTVQESMNRVGTSAMQALTDLDNADYTPTITPVVDLSDTEQNPNWAQSLFAQGDGSFNAESSRTANLAAAAAQSMSNQNGTASRNDDGNLTADALDKLGERMDAMIDKLSRIRLVMDSGRTVGELVTDFDSSMGRRNLLAERGVI